MPTPDPRTIFEGAPEVFTVMEAAKLINLHHRTIRDAIRSGELEAFLIGGRDPRRAGRGLGYRITRNALQAWYFGQKKAAS